MVPSFATATLGLAVSLAVFEAVSLREQQLAEVEFRARASNHALILQNGINTYLSKLMALRALFDASNEVSRGEFQIFAEEILRDQTAILAVSWIPRVPHAEREAHELLGVRTGLPSYRIYTVGPDGRSAPSPKLEEYFPVFYSSREPPNSRIYGLDLNDGGVRQPAIERARDGDHIATSSDFALQSGTGNRQGFSANQDSMAIIRAVTSLGCGLGMSTTGEGIETCEEFDYLKQQGCTEGQGYLFGKAQPAHFVHELLAKQGVKAVA